MNLKDLKQHSKNDMKKIIRHAWVKVGPWHLQKSVCKKCGTVRYWDFSYGCIMYQWGTHLTYKAPDCIIELTGVPYNRELVLAIKKQEGK